MEFNRIVSIVLGFLVVVLLLIWISNRFRSNRTVTTNNPRATVTVTVTPTGTSKGWNPFAFLFKKNATPTPTPSSRQAGSNVAPYVTGNAVYLSPTPQRTAGGTTAQTGQTNQTGTTSNIKSIPATGSPTLLLPLLFSALAGGTYLSRRK